MTFHEPTRTALLLLMLLNPFLLVIYLFDVFEKISARSFARVMIRAGAISTIVFVVFAIIGEVVFTDILQAQFASFQVFGESSS